MKQIVIGHAVKLSRFIDKRPEFRPGYNHVSATRIEDWIRLREMRPFRTEHRPYLAADKSIFTKIVGEPRSGGFELSFAAFLEAPPMSRPSPKTISRSASSSIT